MCCTCHPSPLELAARQASRTTRGKRLPHRTARLCPLWRYRSGVDGWCQGSHGGLPRKGLVGNFPSAAAVPGTILFFLHPITKFQVSLGAGISCSLQISLPPSMILPWDTPLPTHTHTLGEAPTHHVQEASASPCQGVECPRPAPLSRESPEDSNELHGFLLSTESNCRPSPKLPRGWRSGRE